MEEIKHQELVNYKLEQIAVRLDKIDRKLEDGDSRFVPRREFEELKIVVEKKVNKEDYIFIRNLVIGAYGLVIIQFATIVIQFILKRLQ